MAKAWRNKQLAFALAYYPSTREHRMNWDQIAGNWKQFEGKVQQQWGKLTNDDLQQVRGDQKMLTGKIQERYGVTKEEAERQLKDWSGRL